MKKRGVIFQELLPWIIGIGLMILVLILYLFISGNMNAASDFIKSWLRFGR